MFQTRASGDAGSTRTLAGAEQRWHSAEATPDPHTASWGGTARQTTPIPLCIKQFPPGAQDFLLLLFLSTGGGGGTVLSCLQALAPAPRHPQDQGTVPRYPQHQDRRTWHPQQQDTLQ